MKLEIHPFLEEVARWIDADYVAMNQSWDRNPLAARLNAVLEVFACDFAVKKISDATIFWKPEHNVSALLGLDVPEPPLELEFDGKLLEIPVNKLAKLTGVMRHAFNKTVVSFQCHGQGYTEVDGRDPVGLRRWKLTKLGRQLQKHCLISSP
jgi:hypothetical protein